jgi:hypothetical protein
MKYKVGQVVYFKYTGSSLPHYAIIGGEEWRIITGEITAIYKRIRRSRKEIYFRIKDRWDGIHDVTEWEIVKIHPLETLKNAKKRSNSKNSQTV